MGYTQKCWGIWLVSLQGHSQQSFSDHGNWEKCSKTGGKQMSLLPSRKGIRRTQPHLEPWEGDETTNPGNIQPLLAHVLVSAWLKMLSSGLKSLIRDHQRQGTEAWLYITVAFSHPHFNFSKRDLKREKGEGKLTMPSKWTICTWNAQDYIEETNELLLWTVVNLFKSITTVQEWLIMETSPVPGQVDLKVNNISKMFREYIIAPLIRKVFFWLNRFTQDFTPAHK